MLAANAPATGTAIGMKHSFQVGDSDMYLW